MSTTGLRQSDLNFHVYRLPVHRIVPMNEDADLRDHRDGDEHHYERQKQGGFRDSTPLSPLRDQSYAASVDCAVRSGTNMTVACGSSRANWRTWSLAGHGSDRVGPLPVEAV